jgi:hypothetical protein
MVQTGFVELKEKWKRKQKKIILKQYVSLCQKGELYPQHEAINSQCNAQANAGLKRIKDQLSCMTADNFMTHCSLYLWNKNMKIIDKFNS